MQQQCLKGGHGWMWDFWDETWDEDWCSQAVYSRQPWWLDAEDQRMNEPVAGLFQKPCLLEDSRKRWRVQYSKLHHRCIDLIISFHSVHLLSSRFPLHIVPYALSALTLENIKYLDFTWNVLKEHERGRKGADSPSQSSRLGGSTWNAHPPTWVWQKTHQSGPSLPSSIQRPVFQRSLGASSEEVWACLWAGFRWKHQHPSRGCQLLVCRFCTQTESITAVQLWETFQLQPPLQVWGRDTGALVLSPDIILLKCLHHCSSK